MKPKLTTSLWFRTSLVGLITILSTVCGKGPTETKITLAENITPVSAPVTVARVKDFFKSEGLNCNTVPFASGRLALDAMLGGAADFATVAETPIVLAAMQGQSVRLLCTFTSSERNTKVLGRRDRGVVSAMDLRGKRIGITLGSNGAYFLDVMLRTNGLTSEDVHLVNLNPPDMAAAITGRDVDAICTWEPHIWNAKKKLGENFAEIGNKPGQYTQTFNILVKEEYAEQHPAVLAAFLKALLRSESFMQQNQADVITIVAKENNMAATDLEAIWSDYDFRVTLNSQLVNALTGQAEWALRMKIAPPESRLPPMDRLILRGPLHSLRANSVVLE